MKIAVIAICATAVALIAIAGATSAIIRSNNETKQEQACLDAGGTWKLGFFHHTKCKLRKP